MANCCNSKKKPFSSAFTLAELLIALAILGVIATFTIPKILDTGSGSKHNAIVKEVIATVSGAYQSYKLENSPSTAVNVSHFTPYMNYVEIISDGTTIDNVNGSAVGLPCTNSIPCIRFHSGAMLRNNTAKFFAGTVSTSAIQFQVDPDGTDSGVANGASKSIKIFIYYNGRIAAHDTILPNTCDSVECTNPTASVIPDYFSWSN